MSCEIRVLVCHVHGQQADIDSYFAAVDEALDKVEATAAILWPGLDLLDTELDELEGFGEGE